MSTRNTLAVKRERRVIRALVDERREAIAEFERPTDALGAAALGVWEILRPKRAARRQDRSNRGVGRMQSSLAQRATTDVRR